MVGTKARRTEEKSAKPDLIEAIRLLAASTRHLELAIDKTNQNAQLFDTQHQGSGGALVRWIRRVLQKADRPTRVYEVEFVDVATAASKTEKIDYESFIVDASRFSHGTAAYLNKLSAKAAELENAAETRLFETLESLIVSMQKFVKILPALHETFSADLPRESRETLKGVKLEANAIRNAIVKANQKRHDYLSQIEEKEQLKKLGIDQEPSRG